MSKTKRLLCLIFSLSLMCACLPQLAAPGQAADEFSGTCGEDLTWSFDESTGLLTVSGSGKMDDYTYREDGCAPWYPIRDSITGVSFSGSPESIGSYAFRNCSRLESVSVPGSVESIGASAFSSCSRLTDLTIGDGVQSIGVDAFYECEGLTAVSIPDSVRSIGNWAFGWCISLERVTIGNGVERIGDDAFEMDIRLSDLTLGSSVKNIGDRAFTKTALTSVFIPESVKEIGENAFPEETALVYEKDPSEGLEEELSESDETPLPTGNSLPAPTGNAHDHHYDAWSKVINSYYWRDGNGYLCRLENTDSGLILERYTADNRFVESWTVPSELPLFGGFYAGSDGYYFVFGDNNKDELDDKEVIRVVKYSKGWKRMGSASVYGANTSFPFSYGSLRFTETDTYLYIRTCHRMYTNEHDGLRHQANMTLILYKRNLGWFGKYYKVSGKAGYVSHSFNQFIEADGDTVVTVDHGDTFPRSIVMNVFPDGDMSSEPAACIDLFAFLENFPQSYQYTRAGVGGLAVLDDSYLVAFCSADQTYDSSTRNVWLSVVNKSDYSFENIPVSAYPEGGGFSASTPQLVRINGNLAAVLWENTNAAKGTAEIQIAFFDGTGNQLGQTRSISGTLSDCQPVMIDGSICWYSGADDHIDFYSVTPVPDGDSIRPSEPQKTSIFTRMPFLDIREDAYYRDAVFWAVNHRPQITNGMTPTTFAPDASCTRGQIVTFLWRAAGCPQPPGISNPFTDVAGDAYYYQAVLWAVEKGITKGTSATTFGPGQGCTRGQVVTFLYRFRESPEVGTTSNPFLDVNPSAYYHDAVMWAVENKVTNGVSPESFAPGTTCTRGQIVTFLNRAMK